MIILLALAAGWSMCIIYYRILDKIHQDDLYLYDDNDREIISAEELAKNLEKACIEQLDKDQVYKSMELVADFLLNAILVLQDRYSPKEEKLTEDEWVREATNYAAKTIEAIESKNKSK